MDFLFGVFFGLVQGLTEFLPVSSSGHLVIVQALFPKYAQPGIFFDVVLHAATLFAVIYYFWPQLAKLKLAEIKYYVVATIPAAIVGYLLKDTVDTLFSSLLLVGLALLITSVLDFSIDLAKKDSAKLTLKNTFLIGVAQALAILPGISRSGSTIFAARMQGIEKKAAAQFSFLLSIPAIAGANLLELLGGGIPAQINTGLYIGGFLAAFVSGLLAIKLVLNLLVENKFKFFGWYCLLVGFGVLLVNFATTTRL